MFEEKKEAHFVDFVYFEGIAGSFMASGKLGLEVRGKEGRRTICCKFYF